MGAHPRREAARAPSVRCPHHPCREARRGWARRLFGHGSCQGGGAEEEDGREAGEEGVQVLRGARAGWCVHAPPPCLPPAPLPPRACHVWENPLLQAPSPHVVPASGCCGAFTLRWRWARGARAVRWRPPRPTTRCVAGLPAPFPYPHDTAAPHRSASPVLSQGGGCRSDASGVCALVLAPCCCLSDPRRVDAVLAGR